MSGFLWESPVDFAEQQRLLDKIHADIERVGWSAIHVFEDETNPTSFTYTIGLLESYDHPELIVYGIKSELAHGLLASAIDQIKDGTRFEDGERYAKVIENHDVLARFHPPGPPLNWSSEYNGSPVEAVQLVWPDEHGVFPDEEGFDEKFVGRQDQRPDV